MHLSFHPLLSILFSLLIVNGFYNLSKIISKTKYLVFLENYAVQGRLITFFLIVNFCSIILYTCFLFFGVNESFLKILVILLILIGFYKPDSIQELVKKINLIDNKIKLLLFLIIFGYFLISLLPITDPDSLNYHLTMPYLSLLNEKFFIEKEWFTSQLSGAGEALIIFGLSINAYKLSSILQFSALLAIIVAILNLKNSKNNFDLNSKILICLSILCIPAFLFLTFTAKPQLFSIGTNLIAFLITLFILPFEKNKKKSITIFCIISFLCLSSTQFKFSFFLSSGIILLFAYFEMIKKKLLFKSLLITFIFFVLVVFPREYYDYQNLSSDIVKNFFNPVRDNYLAEDFIISLKHGPGNPRYWPYWIFVPYYINQFTLSVVTEIVGLSVLIFLVNFKFRLVKKFFLAAIIFFIIALPFGQPTGRFFIEPFLWLVIGSIYYLTQKNNLLFKIFKKLIIINSIIIFLIISFTVINFLPGIFSINNHKNVLKKSADGYSLYEWANKNLPNDAIVLASHRSYLFLKEPFVSIEFRFFLKTQQELDYYMDLIIQKKPTHLLYISNDHNLSTDIFENCRGKLVKFAKNIQQKVARNPFNKNKQYYHGYIYKIDLDKLKKCKKI